MKVILMPDVAKELINNEDMIKKQEGPYRPQLVKSIHPITGLPISQWVSPIKCWPFEDLDGGFIQQRTVLSGMENEVDDIAFAKIENHKITYKVSGFQWSFYVNPSTKLKEWWEMKKYSIIIYEPSLKNPPIFITNDSVSGLLEGLKEYKIGDGGQYDDSDEGIGEMFDKMFAKYRGILTYIFFEDEDISRCGEWRKNDVW